MLRLFVLFFSVFFSVSFLAQETKIGFSAGYMYQYPLGDLEAEYGSNSNIGANLNVKLESNWTFGVEGQILFGSTYKDLSLLGDVVTKDGFIIGAGNSPEVPEISGRGGNFFFEAGKIFPLSKSNLNSGIHIKGGLGYIFYSALVTADERLITQLSGNYANGYNRLQSGLSYNAFLGYTYYSPHKLFNASIGLQMMYSNMKYEGTFDFGTGKELSKTGFSNMLIGPKGTFTILLKTIGNSKVKTDGYFYN